MKYNKKNINILLIPHNLLAYDLNQLDDLKDAFSKLNINSEVLKKKYSQKKLKIFLEDNNFNVVLAVNIGRPSKLNKKYKIY